MDAQTQPLSDRSTNTHLQSTTASSATQDNNKPANTQYSMDYHRQVLQEKLKNGSDQYVPLQQRQQHWQGSRSNSTSYVSPSDDIMSPCTKKLSDLKSKRFKNAGKPSSLFTKLGKKSFEQSSSAAVKDGE